MSDAVVMMHGYGEDVPEGFRPWEDVVTDRLGATSRVASFFEDHGIDTEIMISGGTTYEGRNEADAIYEVARNRFPDLAARDVILERDSQNTEDNVSKAYELARQVDGDMIVPVSSKDHLPRVTRDWYYNSPDDDDIMMAPVGSQEPYSVQGLEGTQPFTVDPPFHWMYENLGGAFGIPAENRDAFTEEVGNLVEELSE